MRKILLLVAVLFSTATIALATTYPPKAYYRTYSVTANSFATEFMTFENYHAVLQVNNLTRVKNNGDFEVVIEYMKGLQAAIPQTSSVAGRPYYSIPVTAPSYNVKIYNKKKEVVLDKNYGGTQSIIDFGKGTHSTESALKNAWNQQGTTFLQQAEFQNLDFKNLQQEFSALAVKLEDAAPFMEDQQKETNISSDAEDIFATPQEVIEENTPPVQRTFGDSPIETTLENTNSVETTPTPVADERPKPTKVTNAYKNIVKLNLPNLAFRNISLNYERILSDRNSASLSAGFFIPGAAPLFIADALADTPGTGDFSGFSIVGDYRIYSKKKGAPRGFYYAPFAKHANYKYLFDTTIEDNLTNANSALTTYGVGIQLGTQWVIKDRFVIDWGILGVSVQQYNVTSTFTSMEDINFEQIRESLEADIEDNNLIGTPIEFTSGDNFLSAELPFLFGGLRSYLSVGMQF